MQKLKLDLEKVDVLSFPTTPETEARLGARLRLGVTFTDCVIRCGPTTQGTSVCCET